MKIRDTLRNGGYVILMLSVVSVAYLITNKVYQEKAAAFFTQNPFHVIKPDLGTFTMSWRTHLPLNGMIKIADPYGFNFSLPSHEAYDVQAFPLLDPTLADRAPHVAAM